MARFIAQSTLADWTGRAFDILLFVLLLPFVVILSRMPGIDQLVPDAVQPTRPQTRREPS